MFLLPPCLSQALADGSSVGDDTGSFWRSYERAVDRMFARDRAFVQSQESSPELREKQLAVCVGGRG